MASAHSRTIHKPLNSACTEIRLLTLKPSRSDSIPAINGINDRLIWFFESDHSVGIQCELATVSLSDAPAFAALSYVWGDPNDTVEILVNEQPVNVTRNLFVALRRLRRRYWERLPIWIDAICINQSDDAEKAAQVSLMRQIYRRAQAVYMWLGDDDADFWSLEMHVYTGLAAYDLYKRSLKPQEIEVDGASQTGLGTSFKIIEVIATMGYGKEKRWKAFRDLWERSYWSRAWILQECVLARDGWLLAGSKQLPLTDFYNAMVVLGMLSSEEYHTINQDFMVGLSSRYTDAGDRDKLFRDLRAWQEAMESQSSDPSNADMARYLGEDFGGILELAIATRYLQSSNPLDKVYAILGLLPPEQVYIQAAYTRSERQLFIDVIVRGIQRSGNLAYITTSGIGARTAANDLPPLVDLPSWVVDLRRPGTGIYWDEFRVSRPDGCLPNVFNASKGLSTEVQFLFDQSVLEARGFLCGRVSQAANICTGLDKRIDNRLSREKQEEIWRRRAVALAIDALQKVFDLLGGKPGQHPTGQPWSIALFRTLVPCLIYDLYPPVTTEEAHCRFCGLQYNRSLVGFVLLMHIVFSSNPETTTGTAQEGSNGEEPAYRSVTERGPREVDIKSLAWPDLAGENAGRFDFEIHEDTLLILESLKSQGDYRPYMAAHFGLAMSSREKTYFFVMDQGYYGISGAAVEPGDEICILGGCPVPLVIRRVGAEFLLVGDCHIFGMMAGELAAKAVAGEFSLELLRVR